MKKLDWSSILLNVWHLVLLGGTAYLSVSHPNMVPVLGPFIQAAGQFTPSPSTSMTQDVIAPLAK